MKIKRYLTLLLIFCMIMSIVGCSSNDGAPASLNEGGESQEIGGDDMYSIVRIVQDWPTYIDPGVGSSFSCTICHLNLYDPLVFPELDGSVRPHVAKEWTVSEDGLTYTFKIRDDIKFHSGNLMKASDVAFSMNRMLDMGEGYAYLFTGLVKEAVAIDDTTVEFRLERPFGPFISTLVRLMILEEDLVMQNIDKSVATYGEYGDYGKQWLLTNDAGSGPYKVKEVQLEEFVVGEWFPDYFLGWEENAPKYFKISGAIEPVTVRTAMANKELEITDEIQPLENYEAMSKLDGVEVVGYESGTMLNIMLNTKKAPTDCVHYRKAIAYAFDYDTVLNDIYPGCTKSIGPVPKILPGHNPDVVPYTFDMEKAKEELAKSKYANDPDMMKIDLTWCAEVPEQEKIALLVQANLAELGIDVEITKKPFGSMIADAQTIETTPHASFVNVTPSYFEAGSMLKTRYHSSSTGTWEQMEWLQDPVLDAMIDDTLATLDKDERFEKYKEIQEYIVDLCPTIWVFDWLERRACQTEYVDWDPYILSQKGEKFVYPMGYTLYVRDMKVYPERR